MPQRQRSFGLAVRESGRTLYLRVFGEFDLSGVGRVEKALDRLAEAPVPRVLVLDLRGLTFLDLAGLRTILRANERGRAEGFEVEVVRPAGTANRVFTLTRAGLELTMVDAPKVA
jgi:stage II sporulation protein AA (anti-sigma F factor antagonist)